MPPKCPQNGLKMGSFHLLVHPEWSRMILEKCVFDPFLTHFWSQNSPFSRHFGIWDLGFHILPFTGVYMCTRALLLAGYQRWCIDWSFSTRWGFDNGSMLYIFLLAGIAAGMFAICFMEEDQNGPPQAQKSPKTLVLASHMV